jgi:hypothetical protein
MKGVAMKAFTILVVSVMIAILGGMLLLMKPDRIVEVADISGTAVVAVYGKTIHIDPGPAGYNHVFYDRTRGVLKSTLVIGIPRRGIMLTSTKDADQREIRIWKAIYQ